jgi:hypothetical protein
MGVGLGQMLVGDLLGGVQYRLAPLPALAVGGGIGQNPEQPGVEIGARLELVESTECLHHGLLHQVLRIGLVAAEPK